MPSRKPPPSGPCRNCDHQLPHNQWGRCAEPGCECRSADFPAADQPTPLEKTAREKSKKAHPAGKGRRPAASVKAGEVLVFRNPHNDRPVAVPDEIVTAADRVYRAHQLRRRGWSWERIARTEQWPTAAAVAAEVKRYLDEGKSIIGELVAREMLAFEVDRLDALMDAVWDAAMEGKVQAVMAARTLIMDRVKVLGIEHSSDTPDGIAPTTVVVLGGTETEYVDQLRAVAGESAAPAPDAGEPGPDDG